MDLHTSLPLDVSRAVDLPFETQYSVFISLLYINAYTLFCIQTFHATLTSRSLVCGGYGQWDRLEFRSLLQNIVSFIRLFCKRDLQFYRSY